jgi:chromosome segregation ATPase
MATPDPTPTPLVAPATLPTGQDSQQGHLRGLILQKEKELHDINEYRIHTLETLLTEKERDVAENKTRMQKLKDDFSFNLKLLEERDAELERYDASFSSLKAVVRERDQELSELKIATAELQHGVKQERERAAEAEAYYSQKVAQLREEGEAVRWKKDEELRSQRDEFEALKRDCVRQVRELQDTLERERREAASSFDAAGAQREKEHGRRVEELQEKVRPRTSCPRRHPLPASSSADLRHSRARCGWRRARRTAPSSSSPRAAPHR